MKKFTTHFLQSFVLCLFTFLSSFLLAVEHETSSSSSSWTPVEEALGSDAIYWETPQYLEKLGDARSKPRYVYHRRTANFTGDWIISLNMMPHLEGYSDIYNQAISKYRGREKLLERVIPPLSCLWNDVIFLSPLHPHKHYEEYVKLGFTPKHLQFFKIPIEVLEESRVTVWKWLSFKKYSANNPIHEAIDSYCAFDFALYQEMDDLPEDTKEFYRLEFDPANPSIYPRFNWYRIPHILCQDPIDLTDKRITLINWDDAIEEEVEEAI